MRNIFGFWTGTNAMSDNRLRGWETFASTGLKPELITPENVAEWIVPGAPLHAAYDHLSLVHRSDYLRAYFMYHHGGGYADIKSQTGSWLPTVEKVDGSTRLIGAGYREIRGGSVWLQKSPINGRRYILSAPVPHFAAKMATDTMRALRPLLIGNCAYYFKAKTGLARRWLTEVERRISLVEPQLRKTAAPDIRARLGDADGYPLPWASIHGDVLQPLALLYSARLLRSLPRPIFTDYM